MGILNDQFLHDQLQALPSVGEVVRSFLDLSPAVWMMLFGGALWLVILKLPLQAIDRRDQLTGYTYMLFIVASGVILIIALPAKIAATRELTSLHLGLIFVMAVTAVARWKIRRRIDTKISVPNIKNPKESP